MKGFLVKAVLLLFVGLFVLQLVASGVRAAGEALSSLQVPAVLSNPFFVLAALLVVAFGWYRKNEKRLGGQDAAVHRARTRFRREGVRDLLRARPARMALAGGATIALLWYWTFGSIWLFVPVVGGALYVRRRERRRKERGGDDPTAVLVPTRVVREPMWSFDRYQDAPAEYEVWHLLGEGYRSRHHYEHVLLTGRTGHGKGQTVLLWAVAHSIKRGRTSTVAADPKGEAYGETVALAADQRDEEYPDGRPVWLLSTLEKHPPELVAGLNPCTGPEETARFASAIIPDTKEPVWGQGARELFNALAGAVGYPDDCLLRVYELAKYVDRLRDLAEKNEEVAAAYDSSKPGMEENFRKSVKAALSALERERVRRLFRGAGGSGIDFSRINVVYVCFDPEADKDAKPLLAGLLDHLYARAYAAGDPERGGPGVEMIVDEAKKCAAIHKFPDYLSIARGNRVRFLVCVQNVSQLVDELGEPAAEDLLDSLPLKIFGQSGDERTKRRAERESGNTSVVRQAAGGKVPFFERLADPKRARMAEWSGQRWEQRPRVMGDHLAKLPKDEWFVFGDDVAEHVVGAHWRDHAHLIVTPEMKRLPVNRAGVHREEARDVPATPAEPPTPPPEEDGEIPRPATGRERPRLRLLTDEDGRQRRIDREREDSHGGEIGGGGREEEEDPVAGTVRCLYCPEENPAGATECRNCAMPLEVR